ncbi:MAG: right-handed parallel beta-helix repeat-containing protein [Proteobacteria bacterium]|nr:right-handed parallel beta-helix repeat-containing protein [Pseudomonadota bacterium]
MRLCSSVLMVSLVGFAGCKAGADGANGADGAAGDGGVACWDLDGNGTGDVSTEDADGDGDVDVDDCQGEDGDVGDDGTACWDLDGNGTGDVKTEDINGDGVVDIEDCKGDDGDDGDDGQGLYIIDNDMIWSADQELQSVIYVLPTVTLTIEEGVTVTLMPTAGLVVDGTLDIQGGNGTEVTFEAAAGANAGVIVSGTGDTSTIKRAIFDGVDLTIADDAATQIKNVAFSEATLNLQTRTAAFGVDLVTFADNAHQKDCLVAIGLEDLTVMNSTFDGCDQAMVFDGGTDTAAVALSGLSISNSTTGIVVGDGVHDQTATVGVVDFDDLREGAIAFYGASGSVSAVTIDMTGATAIFGDANSIVSVVTSEINDSGGYAVDVAGTLSLDGVTINGAYGGVRSFGTTYLGDSTVDNIVGVGFDITGDASITGTGVDTTSGTGIVVTQGNLTIDTTDVANAGDAGIYVSYGDFDGNDVTVDGAGTAGIYAFSGALPLVDGNVTDILGPGLAAKFGDVDLTDTVVDGVAGNGVVATGGDILTAGCDVLNTADDGIVGDGDLEISNTDVDGVDGFGIHGIGGGSVTVTNSTVSNTGNTGIYADGAVDVSGTNIDTTGNFGIAAYQGSLEVDNCTVDSTLSSGIYSNLGGYAEVSNTTITAPTSSAITVADGDLVVDTVTASGSVSGHGIHVNRGDVDITDVDISDVFDYGVYVLSGDLTADALAVTSAGSMGVRVNHGSADLHDVTITDPTLDGVFIWYGVLTATNLDIVLDQNTAIGGRGIYILGNTTPTSLVAFPDVTLDTINVDLTRKEGLRAEQTGAVIMTDAIFDTPGYDGYNGLYILHGECQFTNVDVSNAGANGIYCVAGAKISDSIVSDSVNAGLLVTNDEAVDGSLIENCDLDGNGTYGIQCHSGGNSNLTLSGNNVTDNSGWAVLYCEQVNGNYIANNNGEVAVELTETSPIDGVFNTTTSQVYQVDAISGGLATEIAGTGPQP